MVSCTKDECRQYNLVTESNESEANAKCKGLANSYPSVYKVISSNSVGCLTNDELKQAKKGESVVMQQLCNGVFITVRVNFTQIRQSIRQLYYYPL